MSKETETKREIEALLAKSRKNVLERIEAFRLQIKEVRERELSKALIPVHDHRPGTTVGAGSEDVPYGKLNPKGVNKSVVKNSMMGYGGTNLPTQGAGMAPGAGGLAMSQKPVVKAEMCKKCGNMHMPLDKCGADTMVVGAKKAELQDEKGHRESNSVNTPHPTPKKQGGDKGGIVLPGANLKKALTAGVPSGVPSTKVNDVSKNDKAPKVKAPSVAMAGNMKQNPRNTFPNKNPDGGQAKPKVMHVQPDAEHKSEYLSKPPVSQAQRAAMGAAAGGNSTLGIPKSVGKEFIDADKGGKLPAKKAEPEMAKAILGSHSSVTNDKPPKKTKPEVQRIAITSLTAKPAMPSLKSEPPTAKPPSGKNMATAVPTSTAKSELTKGMFAQAAQQADPVSASHAAQVKPPAGKVKLPGASAQAGRAAGFGAAMAGEFQPKGPISSGLELATPAKPASPAGMRASGSLGLASPKAAGVLPGAGAKPAAPQSPAAKPGIFGKIGGFRKP